MSDSDRCHMTLKPFILGQFRRLVSLIKVNKTHIRSKIGGLILPPKFRLNL